MYLYTIRTTDRKKADMISNGVRMFDIMEDDIKPEVGDAIHYNLIECDENMRHRICDFCYIVTCVEIKNEQYIVNLQRSVMWSTYVEALIEKIFRNELRCAVDLFGFFELEESRITAYDGYHLTITDKNGNPHYTSIEDIAHICVDD